jgi:hypothetical protein
VATATTAVAREQLCGHISLATRECSKAEETFSLCCVLGTYNKHLNILKTHTKPSTSVQASCHCLFCLCCGSFVHRVLCWSFCPEIGISSNDWALLSRLHAETETESSLRNVVLSKKLDDG